jgi:hypothetical protein
MKIVGRPIRITLKNRLPALPLEFPQPILLRPDPLSCPLVFRFALPDGHVDNNASWTRTAALLLERADVAVVSRQAHLALFCEARLGLKAMG